MTNVEAAAALVKRRSEATPGEMYIRKLLANPEAETRKQLYSRSPVFQLWKDLPGDLRTLTLPGHDWKLEHRLYRYRKGMVVFTAVENDPAIYQVSLTNKPKNVKCFECVDLERFIFENPEMKWTAAWLDFNGPLKAPKILAIKRLWPRLSHSLVLTFMASRYDAEARKLYRSAGSWGQMLANLLRIPRSSVAESGYNQGVGMRFFQLTALKSGKVEEVKLCHYINGIKLEELYNGNER